MSIGTSSSTDPNSHGGLLIGTRVKPRAYNWHSWKCPLCRPTYQVTRPPRASLASPPDPLSIHTARRSAPPFHACAKNILAPCSTNNAFVTDTQQMGVMPAIGTLTAGVAKVFKPVEQSPKMASLFDRTAKMNKFEFEPHGNTVGHTIAIGPVGSGKCTSRVLLEVLTPVRADSGPSGVQDAANLSGSDAHGGQSKRGK